MIVAKLQGGMGNQMFQYALARRLADDAGSEVGLDLTFLLDRTPRPEFVFRDYDLDLFRVRARVLAPEEARALVRLPAPHRGRGGLRAFLDRRRLRRTPHAFVHVREKGFAFDREVLSLRGNVYLDGYWQSPRYFEPIAADLRSDFALRDPLPTAVRELGDRIASVNSVLLNVRRADLVTLGSTNAFHGVCDMDYFRRALEAIVPRIGPPEVFVTGDDVAWCRENVRLPHPTTILDHDLAGPRFSHYLALMTRCRHFVIPNSTFAWWAAWLAPNPEKVVVAPLRWFRDPSVDTRDLIPPEWLRV